MFIVHITIYRFNAIPIKIPMVFLKDIEKKIIKLTWNIETHRIVKGILRKKRTKLKTSHFLNSKHAAKLK